MRSLTICILLSTVFTLTATHANQNLHGITTADQFYLPLTEQHRKNNPLVSEKFASAQLIQELQYPKRFTVERQKLHIQVLEQYLKEHLPKDIRSVDSPLAVFPGGPFGSGKDYVWTQFLKNGFVDQKNILKIDPDDIRRMIPEFYAHFATNPEKAATIVHDEAMFLADLLLDYALEQKWNVCFQSSLKDFVHWDPLFHRILKTKPYYSLVNIRVKTNLEALALSQHERVDHEERKPPEEYVLESYLRSPKSMQALEIYPHYIFDIDNSDRKGLITKVSIRQPTGELKAFPVSVDIHQSRNLFLQFPIVPIEEPPGLKHLIFDIDYVLATLTRFKAKGWQHVDALTPHNYQEGRLEQREHYRVRDFIGELITLLSQNPNVRISIVSGGQYSRNLELLKKIKPPGLNGKSLYDVAYRILSFPDLKVNATAPDHKDFSRRFIKQTQLITKYLHNAVFFEDQDNFLKSSGTHGIFLGRTFEHVENLNQLKLLPSNKYKAENMSQVFMERYLMAAVYATILPWIEGDTSVFSASQKTIVDLSDIKLRYELMVKGIQALKLVPRQSKLIDLPIPDYCDVALNWNTQK